MRYWIKNKSFYLCKKKFQMRLNLKDIQTIIRIAKEIYGEDVSVYLFGSRTDDTKRGGDIDLLIRTKSERKGILDRIRMKARLKQVLGDQKIDIIGDYEDSAVAREAIITGIRLV